MLKNVDGTIALISLALFAVWLFVLLPLIYIPGGLHVPAEILGVKPGEWLLFLATLGFWFATWRLVKGAEQTAERQLRAYVHVVSSTVSNLTAGNGNVVFTMVIKNSGQTPAYATSFAASVDFALASDEAPILPTPTFESLRNIMLGPGSQHTVTVNRAAYSQNEIADLTATNALYVHGIVQYVDAFNERRFTKFCLAKGGSAKYPLSGSDLYAANEGNKAN